MWPGAHFNWAHSRGNIPETELSVARGIGIPVGKRLEGTVQPGPLDDKGSQGWVGHRGCWSMGFGLWW